MPRRGVGKAGFVAEHGLLSSEQQEAGDATVAQVERLGLRTIRMIWVDQHGAPRGKFMSADDYAASLQSGIDFSGAVLNLDTTNHVFALAFAEGGGLGIPELTGFPDMLLVPDPTTFRVLPWADRTGWVLTDAYFDNGRPVPLDTRHLLRRQLAAAAERGLQYVSGLEVEFYVVRRDTPGRIELDQTGWPPPVPAVSAFQQGYQYLSEVRLAGVDGLVNRLRDGLLDVGLPLRSIEDEWGPGQLEVTFDPLPGTGTADAMILFRSAAKQICEQLGLHATFMCRPALPNFFSSGWHLHESLADAGTGANRFASDDPTEILSPIGRQFVAGLVEHALGMAVFSTPTINGYKRFKPYSFAPDRVTWGVENRGTMIRIQGGAGDEGTHVENRLGEPAANPYLYLAANVAAGLDGIRRSLQPPPLAGPDPYAADAPKLPASLWEAVDALEADSFFSSEEGFGETFVRYLALMKRAEVSRFLAEVTDWEMREYFEFY
jgi:glutamine synthetase